MLKRSVYKKKVVKENAVYYFVPGVGKIILVGTGIIIIGGVTIKAATWMYKTVKNYYASKKVQKICKIRANIPNRIIDDNGNVDLGKFNQKVKNKTAYKEKGGWQIDKDNAGHGGRKWKLKASSGNRKASLDENGKILGK